MRAYERITEEIITRLEAGVPPWLKPWTAGRPRNLMTGKPYRGVNALLLGGQDCQQQWWLTFRQARHLGGSVKRGEHGLPVVYWQPRDEEARPVLRTYTVFNVDQCTGIGAPDAPEPSSLDQIVDDMPNPPRIIHGSDRASYQPRSDTIRLPGPATFDAREAYYATLFHELVHSTGHATRLNRPSMTDIQPPGSPAYAREELTAEIGAAFLCAHTGISPATIENTAAYVHHWLTRLDEEPRMLVRASSAAQTAVDYIRGRYQTAPVLGREGT